ncbi:MAG: S8 family serine peptidase, partial [Actinomycetota bacterium]
MRRRRGSRAGAPPVVRGAAALAVASLSLAWGAPAPAPAAGAPAGVRVVLHLAPGAEGAAAGLAAGARGRVARRVDEATVAVVVPDAAAARRLARDPRVGAVEEDVVYRAAVEPNDPCLTSCFNIQAPSQYGVRAVGGPEAWNVTRGRPDVLVAVIDSGVDSTHSELAGKVIHGANLSGTPSPDDRTGHGTGIAGTIAAIPDNAEGIAGLG